MKNGMLMAALLIGMTATAQYNGNKELRHHGMLLIVEYELPVNGSPFVNEIYKKGTITVHNAQGNLEEERLMRFNAFTGEMEYLSPGGKAQTLLKRENIEVELDGFTYQVHPYKVNGKIYRGYFIPMNQGEKVVLYKKPVKNYRKPAMPEHGYEEARKPEYFDASEYFLSTDGAGMEPVRLSKKGLLSSLDGAEPALKAYISDHRLNLTDPKDALDLINYYNSLAVVN